TVATVAGDPQAAVGAHLDSVWLGIWPRHRHQLDFACCRDQAAHHVAYLQGEPKGSLVVEDRRMWIAGGGVGHFVFGDSPGARIEFADRPVAVPRVPDVALLVGGHGVWLGVFRQGVFPDFAGFGIELAYEIAPHPRPPYCAIRCLNGVTGPLPDRPNFPLPARYRIHAAH